MIDIFDLLEFQVLAAARGMEDYYGFFADQEAAKEDIYYTIYQMARSGILKQEGEDLVIQPPVSGLMDVIAASPYVLVIDRGQYMLPRQCIYCHGGIYVCLENCNTDISKISICGLEQEEFNLQLRDLDQMPQPYLTEDMGDYDFEGYWEGHMPEELKKLLSSGLEAETEEYLEFPQVHSVFALREKEQGKLLKRMFLLDPGLEFCLVLQEGDSLTMERYSRERAESVLEAWWRDEG